MRVITQVRHTIKKFEELKTSQNSKQPCVFCENVDCMECRKCPLASRLLDDIENSAVYEHELACCQARYGGRRKPKALNLYTDRARWDKKPIPNGGIWVNGFIDFLKTWERELSENK